MTCGSYSTIAFHPVFGTKLHHPKRIPAHCSTKFTLRRFPGHTNRHRNLQVSDHGDKVQLSIDLPGVKASALKVQVADRILSVSATRQIHTVNGVREVEYDRRFRLDESIDSLHATANLADGVLVLTAPKIQKIGSRTIPVSTNKQAAAADDHGDDDVVLVDTLDLTTKEPDGDRKPAAVDSTGKVTETDKADDIMEGSSH